MDGRIEVARNCEIDQQQRLTSARSQRVLDISSLENPTGCARRRNEDVDRRELLAYPFECHRLTAEIPREPIGSVGGAVRDPRDLRAARQEIARSEVADLARADHEDAPAA